MVKKNLLIVEKSEITMMTHGGKEYISLSDIAKGFGEPRITIQNWMRTRNTIQFLGVWETINNPDFNHNAYNDYLFEAGSNAFSMSPTNDTAIYQIELLIKTTHLNTLQLEEPNIGADVPLLPE